MDKGKTYINMCEKAKRFLSWSPVIGNWCKLGSMGVGVIIRYDVGIKRIYINNDYHMGKHERVAIPLWQQDQLQAMVNEDASTLHNRMTEFIIRYAYVPIGRLQPSYEQLWLSYVMFTLYKKRWDYEKEDCGYGRKWFHCIPSYRRS